MDKGTFAPIAIVGRGCVLPGANTPDGLWDTAIGAKSQVTGVPEGRWGLDPALVAGVENNSVDATYSDAGGYVTDFERHFDATGLNIDPDVIHSVDPLFRWVMHSCREALAEAGIAPGADALSRRAGVILGNLSFPTESMAYFGANETLAQLGIDAGALGIPAAHPYDRFMSGLPAHLTARALGLTAGAFCLDAACAKPVLV